VVSTVSPHEIVEMFEVMAELEAMCARLAARRMSAAEHAKLLEAHQACSSAYEARDPDEYYYRNEVFHQTIFAGSHNHFLAEQARALSRRLRPYRRLQLRVRDRMRHSFGEHDAVVKAIIDGDGQKAADLLRSHVAVQGQRFTDLVASLEAINAVAA
jgi:DNA-binding GntR family transcriptional regulator